MKETPKLKVGYTTGSHAASALKAALLCYFSVSSDMQKVEITLPIGEKVFLDIDKIEKSKDFIKINVIKSDNDDIDVTKGCKIVCWLGKNLDKIPFSKHKIPHKSYLLETKNLSLNIFAGKGLGIVTKPGLAAPVGFPAINAVPLQMMRNVLEEITNNNKFKSDKLVLNVVFEVLDGDKIAQDTANSKVGVMGGISILGKKGLVKPISNEAYLESLKSYISVASYNETKTIVLTIGNSSIDYAVKNIKFPSECYIEIGDHIFYTLKTISKYSFKKIILVTSIGKLVKIAQKRKNTNNRYGAIDFNLIKAWLEDNDFPEAILNKTLESSVVAAIDEYIKKEYPEYSSRFHDIILNLAQNTLSEWLKELNLENLEFEIILVTL